MLNIVWVEDDYRELAVRYERLCKDRALVGMRVRALLLVQNAAEGQKIAIRSYLERLGCPVPEFELVVPTTAANVATRIAELVVVAQAHLVVLDLNLDHVAADEPPDLHAFECPDQRECGKAANQDAMAGVGWYSGLSVALALAVERPDVPVVWLSRFVDHVQLPHVRASLLPVKKVDQIGQELLLELGLPRTLAVSKLYFDGHIKPGDILRSAAGLAATGPVREHLVKELAWTVDPSFLGAVRTQLHRVRDSIRHTVKDTMWNKELWDKEWRVFSRLPLGYLRAPLYLGAWLDANDHQFFLEWNDSYRGDSKDLPVSARDARGELGERLQRVLETSLWGVPLRDLASIVARARHDVLVGNVDVDLSRTASANHSITPVSRLALVTVFRCEIDNATGNNADQKAYVWSWIGRWKGPALPRDVCVVAVWNPVGNLNAATAACRNGHLTGTGLRGIHSALEAAIAYLGMGADTLEYRVYTYDAECGLVDAVRPSDPASDMLTIPSVMGPGGQRTLDDEGAFPLLPGLAEDLRNQLKAKTTSDAVISLHMLPLVQ